MEDQHAHNALMTALNNDKLSKDKLGHLFASQMKVGHHAIKRGRVMCKDMEDMDSKRWIGRPLVVPKNAIGVGELVVDYRMLVCSHSRRYHHYLLTTYRI